ncbi:response regulator [Roseibium denhamense]|uniref:Response regulator c-di-GMP phosphodiesterase, RpfG family, contains REC and HD-GYP domains n=1 Tax=Roseibium denhamense TaxID=76305 RepID=A0ABY1P2C1_9HYPH|nr:HD domain-containing phosphohydrolase [Roseibium denhamense]MTI07563.1 response regulator [Roseibium denhamense]SMP23871.1 Response regulator c-di-GMP phosphodiesterase, RpfG family, contains REC and HD-GYP domains [Roseibium denhamense]
MEQTKKQAKELIIVADPDQKVQEGFKRLFSSHYRIQCFSESDAGLRFIKDNPSAAVIFSCYNLPGRGGVAFLRASETIVPLATRIMLTRESSVEAVKKSLNEAHAFMFLDKPVKSTDLISALETALAHHTFMSKERALLERTLSGSIKMLIDMLAVFHPDAFRRTAPMRKQALMLAKATSLRKTWELEIAVMLSPLGEALLPKEIIAKYRAARSLTEQERDVLNKSPDQTRELLKNIPQLEKVSEYLYLSGRGFDGSGFPKDGPVGEDIPVAARIIRLLTDLWYASPEDGPDAAAFEALAINRQKYDPNLLHLAQHHLLGDIEEHRKKHISHCYINSLRPGDILVDDVLTEGRHELVLSRGHPLTLTTIRRLDHFNRTAGVRQPVRVIRHEVPAEALADTA